MAVQDAKEWQSAQDVGASSARNLLAGPPAPPSFENEKLVCYVDAAWDASTRNCGFAGIFKGSEHGKIQSFKDSRRYVESALIAEALAIRKAVLEAFMSNVDSLLVLSDSQTLVKLLKTKGSRTELSNILTDIYYFGSRLKACSFYVTLRPTQWQSRCLYL
ncbi:hypothetical protein Bca52824_047379 [Brassica carinata]|uniref:RNase H type-1 domain-containing protein n=1 Tax=Brassica carinata TaxID=52824 RepID=A0A8X7UPX1_BRACI|nr:hypothetical protein Bca52824_047379 [Brassica carinata]